MSKLSIRLELIAGLVDKRVVCDVGCDHGKLINYLFENNLIDFAVVSDISLPSLNKATELLSINNYNFKSHHCDGLTGYVSDNIEQCIISGMGGDEIIKIISNSPININSYILSPQHNGIDVKKYMLSCNYHITYDIIIEDKGKFYNIFKCDKCNNIQELSLFDLYFGKDNFTKEESAIDKFVESELSKIEKLVDVTSGKRKQDLLEYLCLLQNAKERRTKYE